ncbi:uncharacterized protein LOC133202655 isoform X2 [Saccostrea echinata]|uniref:uncharacterized protein LOC133202655 isoform X2 n=1 Tax=Saccostrea echinata TaxID=191078 RepID=UPI002A81E760|nr:uncharacterized protein LOC133202655 isoform X2 [Saccostrea echinata]
MINKGSRTDGGHKPHLRLLDLTFDNGVTKSENGSRPHGGLRGSKKHPLSPYSFNKSSEYHAQLREDINNLFKEEFFDGRGSPSWAFGISKEMTHSGESPFHVHGLLSTSKLESETSSVHNIRRSVTPASSARNTPRKRNTGTSYYRPTTPHQYLTATNPSQLSAKELKYGRPTRTTLLRARQRCASAPVNSYDVRREVVKTIDIDEVEPETFRYADHCLSCREAENSPSTGQVNKEVFVAPPEGESPHAFLTGARYNRAHLLDAKSLSVYGVYMPRTNPQGIFMTGHATQRSRDKGQNIPAVPPDSPRSDVDEASKPVVKRPSTAPGKRLLSSGSSQHPGGRPRSAWGENSTTCHLVHGDTEKVVLVTFKGSKHLKSPESVLPSVTGRTAPKTYFRRPREMADDSASLHAQPPPTPVGAFSVRDESEQVPTESERENLDSVVPNPNEVPAHTDVDQRLDKIVEKADADDKISSNQDTLLEKSRLTSFETKNGVDTEQPETSKENSKEETKLLDITEVTLNGQDSNKIDSVTNEQKLKDEIFITNNENHILNGDDDNVDDTDKENIPSDLKTDCMAEEEIPTQIHVTITEKPHDSTPN